MIKKLFLLLILSSTIISCKSNKNLTNQRKKTTIKTSGKSDIIVKNAKKYLGTKYKYGGTTRKGMDCSGLVYISYKQAAILLPRISREMALKGKSIPLSKTKKGDLLFFKTGKKNRINHVGIVTKTKNKEIFFIHASTTRGVIISSMNEKYYQSRFVKAKRILP